MQVLRSPYLHQRRGRCQRKIFGFDKRLFFSCQPAKTAEPLIAFHTSPSEISLCALGFQAKKIPHCSLLLCNKHERMDVARACPKVGFQPTRRERCPDSRAPSSGGRVGAFPRHKEIQHLICVGRTLEVKLRQLASFACTFQGFPRCTRAWRSSEVS